MAEISRVLLSRRGIEDIIPWLNETVHQLLASLPSKRRLKKRDITLEIVSLRAVIEILTFLQQITASELQSRLVDIEEVTERKETLTHLESTQTLTK